MAQKNDAFADLVDALKILPNVGAKTAQRMAFELLEHKREGAARIAETLHKALAQVRHCRVCNTLCEDELCPICADERRDASRLMIVQTPSDILSMETARCHDGLYFVLGGQINPVQNSDLYQIALQKLIDRIAENSVQEIIIATDFTAEGHATAYVLLEVLKKYPCKISRLSQGMPVGSELEYIDSATLAQSVYERRPVK